MNKSFNSMSHFVSDSESGARQCPVCGKMFKPAPEHAYYIGKNRGNFCCSWTCMRENEKNNTLMNVSRKPKQGIPVRVRETGETFESISECARQLGLYQSLVYRAVMTSGTCNGYHIEALGEEGDAE